MITEETMTKLDAMLKRYPIMGRRKRKRVLVLMAEYIPQYSVERVLNRNRMPQWVSWENMNEEQREQARKIVAVYIDVWTAFWFNNWEFKINSKGDVGQVRKR